MEPYKFRNMINRRIRSLYDEIELLNKDGEIANAEFMINLKQSAIAELQGLGDELNEYEMME